MVKEGYKGDDSESVMGLSGVGYDWANRDMNESWGLPQTSMP